MTDLVSSTTTVVERAEASIRDVLRANADADPGATAVRFLPPEHAAGDPGECITRGELDSRARAYAAALQDTVGAGSRVAVVLRPGIELVCALAGCMYANVVAVPLAPPKLLTAGGAQQHDGRRLITVGTHADVAGVLTADELADPLRELWRTEAGSAPPRHWLRGDAIDTAGAAGWRPVPIDGAEPTLLQYTSGSTGESKGVLVSSANMLAQLRNFAHLVGLPPGGNTVSWMPLFHALGLGHLLLGQLAGGESVFMTPEDFVADGHRWLAAISAADGPVVGGGPNFAFDNCVAASTPQRLATLDLSGWIAAPSGGERIRPSTVEDFVRTFGPCGFDRSAFRPGFGLTEAMQFVSMGVAGDPVAADYDADRLEEGVAVPARPGARSSQLISCGTAGPEAELRVVDPAAHTECAPGVVGELWVRGPVVCQGYYGAPELTAETFGATLSDGTGPFLRTGDLGFQDAAGAVVLCGRVKELIIIRGRNIHPQDVEAVAQAADPALAGVPCAAFAVEGVDSELLVLVQALPADYAGDLAALRRRIARSITAVNEVPVHEVLCVAAADLPRTASGKVRRRATRDAYQAGKLVPVAEAAKPRASETGPETTARETTAPETVATQQGQPEAELRAAIRALPPQQRRAAITTELRNRVGAAIDEPADTVPVDEPLLALGMESVRTIALRYGVAADFAVSLPAQDFLGGTIAGLAERIAAALDDGGGTGGIDWPRLVADPAHRNDPFPLTVLQQAYLVGRSPSYELGGTSIHLYAEHDCAELDLPRLRAALRTLVARQEMLRCTVSEDGTQRIAAEVPDVPVREYDLRGADDAAVQEHFRTLRAELDHQVIPLETWPMFDIRVTWLAGHHAVVHTSLDLLIFDVASVRLFFLEWGMFYRDPDAEPDPIGVSFRDFVLAVQRIPQTEAYRRAKEYWLSRVDTLPPGPELPLRQGVPDALPVRSRRRHHVPKPNWEELKRRAAELGVTPTAVLLAAYSTVLGAWSATNHFTVDVPLFSRYPLHPDIDKVLGDFTSVTLLEVDLRPDDGIAALAQRLQAQLWRDLEHRLFAGPEVAREASRVQGIPPSKYASIVFASIREHGEDQGFEQGEWGSQWLGEMTYAVTQTPQVLLDHQVFEEHGALAFNWDAVENLFCDGVLDAMFGAYTALIDALGESGAAWAPGGDHALPAAQRELIDAANDTATDVPGGMLYDGMLDWARREPERTAIIGADGGTLSYGALRGHAVTVANALREHGAGRHDLVAVALPKGPAQLVAAYGVQLAGAGYLPLDPAQPTARQDELLAHSGVTLVLTPATPERADWPTGVRTLTVDLDREPTGTEPPEVAGEPGDVAYVLYTSGSTGTPKGVTQTHRATLNTLVAANEQLAITPDDRALGLSQLSFDLSVWDIFGVLAAGAAVVLPAPAAQRDPAAWLRLVTEHRVTLWNSVPTLMEMFVEHLADGGPVPLRAVWFSGDWIPVDLPGKVRRIAPGAAVIASGGPTETAIWCVANPLDEVAEDEVAGDEVSIPYGRPMPNHTIRVLDDRLRDCPVWVPGEMYIGGAGLAEGYWRDPERTAAAFVTHPVTGERLYRSGDLGCWLPDGSLRILGRTDFQVKIGGFRIELGEIEARLRAHEEVAAASVVAAQTPTGRQLAAVVVPAATHAADVKAEDLGPDVELDPLRRLEFKAARRGRRTDLSGPVIELPGGTEAELRPDYERRAGFREFATGQVPLAELAGWLENLRSLQDGALPKYRYGSGGGLYPVQAYLAVTDGRVDGLPGGGYYYDPADHRLVRVSDTPPAESAHVPDNRPVYRSSAFTVFLIAQRAAVDPLYGNRARDFCLLEAGLMTQLLETAAHRHGLASCQVGNVRATDDLRDTFALDDGHEVLHALIGGARPQPRDTVPAEPAAPLATRLVEHLAAQLPHYMVPATVLTVDALPTSERGKIDRNRIAELLAGHGGTQPDGPDDGPPSSAAETDIAAVFAEVLGLDSVPLNTGFFDFGATSVLVVKVHRLLRERLGVTFPLMAMFEHTTVRRLAGYLGRTGSGESAAGAGPGDGGRTDSGSARGSRRRAARRRGRRGEA